MNLKQRFTNEIKGKKDFKVLVTLVKLPSGAIEIITNTENIETKIQYILDSYNENFELNHNNAVRIVGYTLY